MANDIFAAIASGGMGGNLSLLKENLPLQREKKECELTFGSFDVLATKKKMDSADELSAELKRQRERYAPYLSELAPSIKSLRKRIDICDFLKDGESVKIPEYGGPIGYCKSVYESSFTLEGVGEDAVYLHFDGADYRAVVYVNGVCVGTHEGFFSPFEFDITEVAVLGENTLKVDLYNDHIYMGNSDDGGRRYEGDKLYAATGLGWDDYLMGWHHCPAGMGIYAPVWVEVRPRVFISDIFVRPTVESSSAEVWIEVENTDYEGRDISFALSLFGRNFEATLFEGREFIPFTTQTVGMADSLTAANLGDAVGAGIPMPARKGKNLYKTSFEIEDMRLWELDTPYLYEIQVQMLLGGHVIDIAKQHFGMRSFTQDTESIPKGRFYLNGRQIKLRGANTMGFEQQDVLRGDIGQLIDDMLLAKICNMNFLRLTQRPVQDKIYEICDCLGLMTQTDLPLFGCMRRTKFAEGVRQAEEMERLVRSHPCNVVVTYINEPFPNAHNQPHRHLERTELESFFECCDAIVRLTNPDRVIKHVDGDYDPPTESLPDNHCYPMWYNGHGIDIGELWRGYWIPTRPDWCYGCGEFGAEGLDSLSVMEQFYPAEWLEQPFDVSRIIRAQTADFHRFFYTTPGTLEDWIEKSQIHQAWATRMMTESFRRDPMMVTFAIHLFIDAWPSGWMKTIMDCCRNPKKAYFAYRDALQSVMVSLRSDRFTYYSDEQIRIEACICNDSDASLENCRLVYELYHGAKIVARGESECGVGACDIAYAPDACFECRDVADREKYTLKAILLDSRGEEISYNSFDFEVFARRDREEPSDLVLLTRLNEGEHEIAGERVTVKGCSMLPLHFVSRDTGHGAVAEFEDRDFSYWYDSEADMITPLLYSTFEANGFTPILTSTNKDENEDWVVAMAVAEKVWQGKRYIICQLDLREENPICARFIDALHRYHKNNPIK